MGHRAAPRTIYPIRRSPASPQIGHGYRDNRGDVAHDTRISCLLPLVCPRDSFLLEDSVFSLHFSVAQSASDSPDGRPTGAGRVPAGHGSRHSVPPKSDSRIFRLAVLRLPRHPSRQRRLRPETCGVGIVSRFPKGRSGRMQRPNVLCRMAGLGTVTGPHNTS